MRDLDYEELTDGTWLYDDLATELEEEDILECFTANFLQMFPSFKRVRPERWISPQPAGHLGEPTFLYLP